MKHVFSSADDCIDAWFYRSYDTWGRSHNTEFDVDTVYSYGTHFPMAIRMDEGSWYLINGDRYSMTTNRHQDHVRHVTRNVRRCIIPFSSLEGAGVHPIRHRAKLELIDVTNDRYVEVERVRRDRETGETRRVMVDEHLLGGAVIKATVHRREYRATPKQEAKVEQLYQQWRDGAHNGNDYAIYKKAKAKLWHEFDDVAYYISAIDETASDVWRNGHFLTRLTGPVSTVAEAFESLKPAEVKAAEQMGIPVFRQGDWFAIPYTDVATQITLPTPRELEKRSVAHEYLPRREHDDNSMRATRHRVTRLVVDECSGLVLARGTVRHSANDHKMLKLGGWHAMYGNVQAGSWTADGRID
jgi:hypothetical protein